IGFHSNLPLPTPTKTIFIFKAYAISCAVQIASTTLPSLHRVAIFSDNNSVEMFNTMRAFRPYNCLLKSVVNILIQQDIDLRVFHIAEQTNTFADALSCWHLNCLHQSFPHILVVPPAMLLEALEA
ncbi:hypothetical protein K439DRAFT_1325386, partial [Ramaria rubella]